VVEYRAAMLPRNVEPYTNCVFFLSSLFNADCSVIGYIPSQGFGYFLNTAADLSATYALIIVPLPKVLLVDTFL